MSFIHIQKKTIFIIEKSGDCGTSFALPLGSILV
jgi:hypothetical protein